MQLLDMERELDVMKAIIDDSLDEVDRQLGTIIEQIDDLTVVVAETLAHATKSASTTPAPAIYQRLREIREQVRGLEIVPKPAPAPEEYTILHHVRVEDLDHALRLAETLSESLNGNGKDVIVATKVTAGVRDLEKVVEKFPDPEEFVQFIGLGEPV